MFSKPRKQNNVGLFDFVRLFLQLILRSSISLYPPAARSSIVKSKLEAEVKEMSSRVEELEKLNAELEEAKNKLKEKSSMVEELNAKLEEEKKATFEIMEGEKAHLLEEFKERKDRAVDLAMYGIWASNTDLDTSFLGSFEDELIAKWKARLEAEEDAEKAKEDTEKAKKGAPTS